jgi:hypothetical protein
MEIRRGRTPSYQGCPSSASCTVRCCRLPNSLSGQAVGLESGLEYRKASFRLLCTCGSCPVQGVLPMTDTIQRYLDCELLRPGEASLDAGQALESDVTARMPGCLHLEVRSRVPAVALLSWLNRKLVWNVQPKTDACLYRRAGRGHW